MGILVWLAPAVIITAIAALWVRVASRPRGPQEPRQTVLEYERFRSVMSTAGQPAQRRGRRRGR